MVVVKITLNGYDFCVFVCRIIPDTPDLIAQSLPSDLLTSSFFDDGVCYC